MPISSVTTRRTLGFGDKDELADAGRDEANSPTPQVRVARTNVSRIEQVVLIGFSPTLVHSSFVLILPPNYVRRGIEF
jgi:hypothetical protein